MIIQILDNILVNWTKISREKILSIINLPIVNIIVQNLHYRNYLDFKPDETEKL